MVIYEKAKELRALVDDLYDATVQPSHDMSEIFLEINNKIDELEKATKETVELYDKILDKYNICIEREVNRDKYLFGDEINWENEDQVKELGAEPTKV